MSRILVQELNPRSWWIWWNTECAITECSSLHISILNSVMLHSSEFTLRISILEHFSNQGFFYFIWCRVDSNKSGDYDWERSSCSRHLVKVQRKKHRSFPGCAQCSSISEWHKRFVEQPNAEAPALATCQVSSPHHTQSGHEKAEAKFNHFNYTVATANALKLHMIIANLVMFTSRSQRWISLEFYVVFLTEMHQIWLNEERMVLYLK